jgi:hypothetical protein
MDDREFFVEEETPLLASDKFKGFGEPEEEPKEDERPEEVAEEVNKFDLGKAANLISEVANYLYSFEGHVTDAEVMADKLQRAIDLISTGGFE